MKIRLFLIPAVATAASSLLFSSGLRASIVVTSTVTNGATPFSEDYGFTNAADGGANDYASQGQGTNTFLEFAFPGARTINRVVVINRDSPAGGDWIGNFTLTFDGGVTSSIARTAARGISQLHSLGGNFTTATVRLDVDTTGDGGATNTGAMEVIFLNTSAGLTPISGVTIAGGATAFNAEYAATGAIDGNIGRSQGEGVKPEYASAMLGNDAYLDFDLGAVTLVGGFDFFDRPAAADRVTGFDMIFSIDSTFGNEDDIVKSYTNTGIALSAEFDAVAARYVRYDVTANAGANPATANTGLSEIISIRFPNRPPRCARCSAWARSASPAAARSADFSEFPAPSLSSPESCFPVFLHIRAAPRSARCF